MNRSVFLSVLLSTSVLACATDPNKAANAAHDEQLGAERNQAQSNAADRSDEKVNAAGAQQENTTGNAVGTPAMKNTTEADARMTEARTVARAKATERMEKVDARVVELKALLDKAGAKAPTSARDVLKPVDTQRGIVASEIARLSNVTDDQFRSATDNLEKQLDTLEELVENAGTEVEKIKK